MRIPFRGCIFIPISQSFGQQLCFRPLFEWTGAISKPLGAGTHQTHPTVLLLKEAAWSLTRRNEEKRMWQKWPETRNFLSELKGQKQSTISRNHDLELVGNSFSQQPGLYLQLFCYDLVVCPFNDVSLLDLTFEGVQELLSQFIFTNTIPSYSIIIHMMTKLLICYYEITTDWTCSLGSGRGLRSYFLYSLW